MCVGVVLCIVVACRDQIVTLLTDLGCTQTEVCMLVYVCTHVQDMLDVDTHWKFVLCMRC